MTYVLVNLQQTMKLVYALILVGIFQVQAEEISSSIPDYLIPCYRVPYRNRLVKPPLNLHLLKELIGKFEFHLQNSINLRMFTTSLLHSVRYDGVVVSPGLSQTEFTIPFRANGPQFYKYKLLLEYMLSGKPQLTLDAFNSYDDLCLLHEMISNTVEEHLNNAESSLCENCAIEKGVVDTKWGVISPGHLIAGIATALQEVSLDTRELVRIIQSDFNKTQNYSQYVGAVDNIWIATIVGDLGEVVLEQAFGEPQFGKPGKWNNTMLPRVYYLENKYNSMTDAELFGAIDGAIFAFKIKEWLSIRSCTRLSQFIDMYYSNRGIAYDLNFKACKRKSNFEELFDDNNWTEQIYNTAHLMVEVGRPTVIPTMDIWEYCSTVSSAFNKHAALRTMEFQDCNKKEYSVQPLEIISMFDESWSLYDVEVFLGSLIQSANVGRYGSALGIINGNSGAWMANITDDTVQLYKEINSNRNRWQMPIVLARGLDATINYLRSKNYTSCEIVNKVPRTTTVLILANKGVLTETDQHTTSGIVNSIKETYPQTSFVYVVSSNNVDIYSDLVRNYTNDYLIETSEDQRLITQILETLVKIPNHFVDFFCNNSKTTTEDYITPDETRVYEIHPQFLKRADFVVKFKGYDYGDMSICILYSHSLKNKECKTLNSNEEVTFIPKNYCTDTHTCRIQFSVTATKSNLKCCEFECRFPDQIRIVITATWTETSNSAVKVYSTYVVVTLLGLCIFMNSIFFKSYE